MIKKLLLAAPLALAAGALFTTPAAAADWGNHASRHSEVTQVSHADSRDRSRDGQRWAGREANRLRDGHRGRGHCVRHEYGRQSHERGHHRWRSERGERHDRR